jgi:replication initiation and membrane attachment protein DnaB
LERQLKKQQDEERQLAEAKMIERQQLLEAEANAQELERQLKKKQDEEDKALVRQLKRDEKLARQQQLPY